MGIRQGWLDQRYVGFEAAEQEPSGTRGSCQGGDVDLETSYIEMIADSLWMSQSSKERHYGKIWRIGTSEAWINILWFINGQTGLQNLPFIHLAIHPSIHPTIHPLNKHIYPEAIMYKVIFLIMVMVKDLTRDSVSKWAVEREGYGNQGRRMFRKANSILSHGAQRAGKLKKTS